VILITTVNKVTFLNSNIKIIWKNSATETKSAVDGVGWTHTLAHATGTNVAN
jgi:hypothetical protein